MAPAYKLTYFDMRGVIEPARFLLKYGGIDFEDIRITHEDWSKLRDTAPFGQLPLLEHNGKKANQSVAIIRYLGKVVKLAGKSDWEDLEIDAVVDTVNDLNQKIFAVYRESDEAKKEALKKTTIEETIPFYLTRLDAIVEKNNGHLALGRLTWADFFIAGVSPIYERFGGDNIFDKYPNLQALRDKVEALPAVKKWIEERPKSDG